MCLIARYYVMICCKICNSQIIRNMQWNFISCSCYLWKLCTLWVSAPCLPIQEHRLKKQSLYQSWLSCDRSTIKRRSNSMESCLYFSLLNIIATRILLAKLSLVGSFCFNGKRPWPMCLSWLGIVLCLKDCQFYALLATHIYFLSFYTSAIDPSLCDTFYFVSRWWNFSGSHIHH